MVIMFRTWCCYIIVNDVSKIFIAYILRLFYLWTRSISAFCDVSSAL